ncbi:91d9e1ff-9cca-4349-a0d4-df20b60fffa4 [Sclerotinia trifoliorum]|uniref:91d9e1ff-9cca-4349-a0d4-df20b60fffa4 n=1 Tax=Sclerotinia trifoliorum TaxID=28548 RepID=A0A8H2VM61_9HELO|nr:91d9e1ff-9cca-4349-a0d4-df20b60fffa4 [Sclerotinia trifoliorum]
MSNPRILLLGTLDSKLPEILYLRAQILAHSNPTIEVLLADVGRKPTSNPEIDIPQSEILSHASSPIDYSTLSRGEYIEHISVCASNLVRELFEKKSIHAIIGIGGSGGTSLCAYIMRNALPIGFPKLVVSTMGSGNTGPYVGETDITMMYSVVDIAGTNSILKGILDNAAGAISGLAYAYWKRCTEEEQANNVPRKKGIGLTMFGITTPCVEMVKDILEKNSKEEYEIYIFHATGPGGKAMERLIREKRIDAVLDVTTTEIADYICEGILSAGPERLSAAAEMGIPQIVSVGACDCVNFGPRNSIPEKFKERVLVQHNPDMTLMRSNADECAEIGKFIAGRLKEKAKRKDLVKVCLPKKGTSMLAVEGGKFHDVEADKMLFKAIKDGLDGTGIEVLEKNCAVNDEEFAQFMAEELIQLISKS